MTDIKEFSSGIIELSIAAEHLLYQVVVPQQPCKTNDESFLELQFGSANAGWEMGCTVITLRNRFRKLSFLTNTFRILHMFDDDVGVERQSIYCSMIVGIHISKTQYFLKFLCNIVFAVPYGEWSGHSL